MDAQTISMNKIQQEAAVKEAASVQKAAGVEAVTPQKGSPARQNPPPQK